MRVKLSHATILSSLVVAVLFYIFLAVNGCAFKKYDKWDWEASDILYHSPDVWKCVERSRELSRRLVDYGIAHSIVHGYYQGKPHAWIEIGGKIYDPSVINSSYEFYRDRYYIEN